jgi:septum formation protein
MPVMNARFDMEAVPPLGANPECSAESDRGNHASKPLIPNRDCETAPPIRPCAAMPSLPDPASQPLILASASPRRRELLSEAGYAFEIVKPEIEEIDDPSRSIQALTRTNARLKAEAVARRFPDRIVIAADTLVLRDNTALGKPADADAAFAMVKSLNGRTHQVFTAVCVTAEAAGHEIEFSVVTNVTFKTLTDDELRRYHSLIDPMDKAGAYAAQDHGDLIIERVEGSWTNVVGLPMERLADVLAEDFGVKPA